VLDSDRVSESSVVHDQHSQTETESTAR
jgi:hypothetical protein